MTTSVVPSRPGKLGEMLINVGPPLIFAFRLWASVCLALFVAFWLKLDNPFWAGTSAAVVCQPQLGASLRKGWFRMIGTFAGATTIVVLTAWFPQDRIAFLGILALWGGVCAFTATLLRNFASYGAALAGYTAAIIAADTLGATGGPDSQVFMIAVWRASEISIGIVCAGAVLAGTDLGGAERRLADAFVELTVRIADGFTRMLAMAGPQLPDTQTERRELARRVGALDPMIDQALGESGHARYQASTLWAATYGLIRALDGWRGVATHLSRSRDGRGVATILRGIPSELRSADEPRALTRWLTDPIALRHVCAEAVQKLMALQASTPSLRLLADEAAKVLAGVAHVLDGLALLVDAPGRSPPGDRGFRLGVPDWLPAFISAARAVFAIALVELFWVLTAWPNGGSAIVFVAATTLLLSPRGELAYGGAIAIALGTAGSVLCAAIIKFALLPALETFPEFCLALGLFLLPVGFAMAQAQQKPAVTAVFTAMGMVFIPLVAPTNQMSYDTTQFYNSALAIVAGCGVAPLAFILIPPLSPQQRMRRLLTRTLRDLRRLAIDRLPARLEDWESRMYSRLAAVPDQADPLQRARLLAALSVGGEIIILRRIVSPLGFEAEFEAALPAFTRGDVATTIVRLHHLDAHLAADTDTGAQAAIALRVRSGLLVIAEALATHGSYFNAGVVA
jgi:uncharacterized membrane protein YccC